MKYYLLQKARNYTHLPAIRFSFSHLKPWQIDERKGKRIATWGRLLADSLPDVRWSDILIDPYFLVSERVKKILLAAEPGMEFRRVSIITRGVKQKPKLYYLPLLTEIECLHASSKRNPRNGALEHPVLCSDKVGIKRIFLMKNEEERHIVVRLDLLEILLRLHPVGLTLCETQTYIPKATEENAKGK
ncbi:MAG: hypothetical protein K6F01_08130 [Selenomonas sp.]|uniref:imm11 family protein n=1 Tax=Selenomonas sp. TaxID=2053611 RepID=UPI0025D5F816|nr:DUF1629 domain-containing protein [Selenomonas sp.]MCR5439379.1 hypothetical protein [Selenomonas sp.]